MAKLVQISYGEESWEGDRLAGYDAAAGKSIFDSLNCPLIETELVNDYVFTVNIDNTVLLTFDSSRSNCIVTSTYNGNTEEVGYIQAAGTKELLIIASDTFIGIEFQDYYPRYWHLCYQKVDGIPYYGFEECGEYKDLVDLSNIPLRNLVGEPADYYMTNILQYKTDDDSIDYIKKGYIGFNEQIENLNYISTSYKDCRTIVTIDGRNYFMISNHIAVEIDS